MTLTEANLEKRISLTRNGQVTWARPDLGKLCTECRHLGNVREKRNGDKVALCHLVKAHTKRAGKEFNVDGAIACSMFTPA